MIFVDSYDRSRLSETFEHPVRPTAVTVLQMLDDFQFQIDVDLEMKLFDSSIKKPEMLFLNMTKISENLVF